MVIGDKVIPGAWSIDHAALPNVVPRALMEDDEQRLSLIQDFQTIAGTLNNPNDQLFPDTDEG